MSISKSLPNVKRKAAAKHKAIAKSPSTAAKLPSNGVDQRDARTRILTAAAQAFVKHGFGSTRLSQIAKMAGVSRSTLYEIFPGKEYLVAAINHHVIEQSLALAHDTLILSATGIRSAAMTTTKATTSAASTSAIEAIRRWLRSAITPTECYRTLLKIMHSDEVQPNLLLLDREATLQSIQDAQKWVRQVLRRGIKSGEIRADIHVKRTAHSLQNIHYLFTKQASADNPLFDFGIDDGETSIELLMRGLATTPTRRATKIAR